MEENREQKVTVIDNNDDNRRNKTKQLFLLIGMGAAAMVMSLLLFLLLSKCFGNTATKSSSEAYKKAEKKYNNILSYINSESQSASKLGADKLISVQFEDENLRIMYKNTTNPGYISINMPDIDSLSSALKSFEDTTPVVGSYTTIIEEHAFDEGTYDTGKDTSISLLSKYEGNVFTSFTYFDETDKSFNSLTRASYSSTGEYSGVTKVKESEDDETFVFYFYLINEVLG